MLDGGRAARAAGGVRAQPAEAAGALSPRARRRVPGHEPAAVAAGRAAGRRVGRRRGRRRRADVDLRRRRSQAVDLPVPPRRGDAARRGRAARSAALRPGRARPAGDHDQLPRRARAAGVRQRAVGGDAGRPRRCPSGSRYGDARSVSRRRRSRRARCATASRCSASSPSRRWRRARRRWPTRSRACSATPSSAIARRAAAAGAAGRHRDSVSRPRRPSVLRGRARGARHPDLRLQGPRLLRRAGGAGSAGAAARISRSPTRTCAPPSSCDRGSSGCPTSALARAGAVAFAAALDCDRGVAGVDRARRSIDLDRAAARRARAPARARAGWRWPIALPPSELVDIVLRESAYAFELRGRRLDQARENVKKVRALVRRVENRGYATLGRLADVLRDAAGRRRIERDRRGRRRREPDDDPRGQGPRVPDRLPRQPAHRRAAAGRAGFSVIERGPTASPKSRSHRPTRPSSRTSARPKSCGGCCTSRVTRARDRLYLAGEIDEQGPAAPRRPEPGRAAAARPRRSVRRGGGGDRRRRGGVDRRSAARSRSRSAGRQPAPCRAAVVADADRSGRHRSSRRFVPRRRRHRRRPARPSVDPATSGSSPAPTGPATPSIA